MIIKLAAAASILSSLSLQRHKVDQDPLALELIRDTNQHSLRTCVSIQSFSVCIKTADLSFIRSRTQTLESELLNSKSLIQSQTRTLLIN